MEMHLYQWAVEVTTEYLDGEGGVEQALVEIRPADSERQARARYEAAADTVAWRLAHPQGGPRYQRIGGARLLKRPVGDWTPVVDDEEIGRRVAALAAEETA